MAAAVINGVQSKGVVCYVKHCFMNDQESNRGNLFTWATEQSMRETYTKSFQMALQEGGSKGAMVGYIIAFLAVGVLCNIPGWGFRIDMDLIMDGTHEVSAITVVLGVLGALWFAASTLFIRMGIKRANRTADDWVKEAAKGSSLPESVVRDFDNQVKAGNASFLILKGKKTKPVPVIITDDYIVEGSMAYVNVHPIQDIIGACYTQRVNPNNKLIKYQYIGLVNKNGNTIIEADEKYGDPFLAYLKERIPSLEVIGDVMITESDYFDWVKKLQKNAQ